MQNPSNFASQPTVLRRRRQQRGMALAAGMLAMLGILSLVLVGVIAGTRGNAGLLSVTENGDTSANEQAQTSAAFNTADSGIEYALSWLHGQGSPPNLTKATLLSTLDTYSGGSYSLNGGTFTVWIFPGVGNSGTVINTNGQETPKLYLIQSTGLVNGVSQTVQAYVSLSSFGKYAFFTDRDPSNLYYVGGLNTYDGPVHFNESDNSPTSVVWKDNAPIFNFNGPDALTYSGSIKWFHNNTGTTQAPQEIPNGTSTPTDQYLSVAKVGISGVSQVPKITMPTTSFKQQYAALGQHMPDGATTPPAAAPGASSPSGITVTPGGGIYIHSANSANTNDVPANPGKPATDVQQMVLSVDGSGNQVITVQQPNDAGTLIQTQITLDRVNGATHIKAGPYSSSSHTYNMISLPDVSGVGNGVIYSDGNIGSTQQQGNSSSYGYVSSPSSNAPGKGLSGVIADNQALTISTYASPNQSDPNNKNINLNGSVTYNTPRTKDNTGAFLPETDPSNTGPNGFMQKAGTLGLVANTVQLVDNNAAGQTLGDVELDATTLVQNTLQTVDVTSYYVDQNQSNSFYTFQGNPNSYAHYLRQPHNFYCMGGEIASVEGGTGVFDGASTFLSGFNVHYTYDGRLASSPPPYFPTTNNQYQVLSWQRVIVPL